MPNEDPVTEVAKAAAEIAKATGKAIDTVNNAGGFFAKITKQPLITIMGRWHDRLAYDRWEQQVDLIERAKKKLLSLGITEPNRVLPLSTAIPLLEISSLQDDDFLRDRWANLLANGVRNDAAELRRTYISIMEQLTTLDVCNLEAIYSALISSAVESSAWTGDLPSSARVATDGDKQVVLDEAIKLSLENLDRCGCIKLDAGFFGGGYVYILAHQTTVGRAFYSACSLKL